MTIDPNKTNGSSPPETEVEQQNTAADQQTIRIPIPIETPENRIQRLWEQYFRDVPLDEWRWFEHASTPLLKKALEIAAKEDDDGRFQVRTQEHIGSYINGIIRNLKNGTQPERSPTAVLEVKIALKAGYEITDKDRQRFKEKLTASGECQLFNNARHARSYGRFHVNRRLIGAHVFAFYMDRGILPAAGETAGFDVAHTCRNRACCNPEHLRLTSRHVNLAERQYRGSDNIEVPDATPPPADPA